MAKIILGLVGEKAGGKGTAADHLADKHGASVHTFSRPMKECLERLGLELTRKNLIAFSELTRKSFGEDLYAQVVAKDSKNDEADLVVVDGIRRPADISLLKEFDNFHLIYITAPVEVRWERAKARGEKPEESSMSLDDFKKEELAPTEIAIPRLGLQANFKIDNSATYEIFHANLERVLGEIDSSLENAHK